MRTWPASTSAAAEGRAFTTRACHSHLSRRCRSNCSLEACPVDAFSWSANRCALRSKTLWLFLPAGELFLQRRQFCKWRIGIDRTVALARRRAGRPLTVRGTAVALVAAALVASAEITAAALALVAVTTTLVAIALVAIKFVAAITVAALAFEALARRTALTCFLACFSRRCALNSCRRRSRCIGRHALARFAKLIVAAATAMTLLARRALGA